MITKTLAKHIKCLSADAHAEELAFSATLFGDANPWRVLTMEDLDRWAAAWRLAEKPQTKAYNAAIAQLDEGDLRDLEALMWYGRGGAGSFAECRRHSNDFPFDDGMRRYVSEKPLWKYLEAALAKWPRR